MSVKYYIVTVFTVECNFAVNLKKNSFPDICLYELLSVFECEELTVEVCPAL
jgi:hypothetical protein